MLGIKYEDWKDICEMYFSLTRNKQRAYLQWYPFSQLLKCERDYMKSEEFFEKYILYSSFVLYPNLMLQTENYIHKGDGTFRDATLISPILYLVLQTIGKTIFDNYSNKRNDDIKVFYSGNYDLLDPSYKKEYNKFFYEINRCRGWANYFIKTDITNFYSSININKLIDKIDENCNSDCIVFSQTNLQIFASFLSYCGDGKFPLVENSIASSYLSTVIYLDDIDQKLYEYIIHNYETVIERVEFVRYVDDMYIMIKSSADLDEIRRMYNQIRNEYTSLLKDVSLNLNSSKSCFNDISKLDEELKKALYYDYFGDSKKKIDKLFKNNLLSFFDDLYTEQKTGCITVEKYNQIIKNNFSSEEIEYTPTEVLNYFVYESSDAFKDRKVIRRIKKLINADISFVDLDPKRLTVIILKTKEEKMIKDMLANLFEIDRENIWNRYNTTIAATYLVQRGFEHNDLLRVMSNRAPDFYEYYAAFCNTSFVKVFEDDLLDKYIYLISNDDNTYYLYFMYLFERKHNSVLLMYAYYKSFFDRISADIDYTIRKEKGEKIRKRNYNAFYKKSQLITFYSVVPNSEALIIKAQDYRKANPLIHASAELLDLNDSSEKIRCLISSLELLVREYIKML